ncbi:MAG: DPP IV N-terminal domain-containing protein [Longimicrobiales bacterium]
MLRSCRFFLCLVLLPFLVAWPAAAGAQTTLSAPYTPDALTDADYAGAERFLAPSTRSLVTGGTVRPSWMGDGTFWYSTSTPRGSEFFTVDVDGREKRAAFDHEALAEALSLATGRRFQPYQLPFRSIELTPRGVGFSSGEYEWICERRGACATTEPEVPENSIMSPDGRYAAYIQDHNLWVKDLARGTDEPLTSDGIEDFGYATNNAGWVRSDRPVLAWSPDSKKIATFQHDSRGVGEMYLVTTGVGHPELDRWKYPLPEDSVVFRVERVVIHVDDPRVVRLQMPPDIHRSTVCDHIYCNGGFADVEWSPDASQLAFVSSTRDHKEAHLRIADPETGAVRDVLSERVETFYESGYNQSNWRVLHDRGEVLWYSARSNWGHLYLYDLETGALKREVTSGEWNVLQLRHIDAQDGGLYLTGAGREGGDPYFHYFYRVGLDDGDVTLLTPDSAHHTISMSPSGDSFVDSWSTPVRPARNAVRDVDGRVLLELESQDISQLVASGWKAPIPFTTKARDGETDLYGLMYTPTDLDPNQKYPVVNYLYPGPQSGSIGARTFSEARRDHQAMAELGFIVITVDAMGTPGRSKSFHEAYYGNMGDNGLPDQVATIRQLAEQHSFIDVDRVGIWGHSGGGFASTAGILRYPDFYKVAVSQAGNHDNRNYEDDWGEKWQGLLETNADGTTTYDNQANQNLAANLKGKLLLAHGTVDDNVPPSNTLLVADALIAANKDFDLLMLPNRRHGFGNEPYMMRKRWDYLVRHLLGAEPPKEFEFGRRPVS